MRREPARRALGLAALALIGALPIAGCTAVRQMEAVRQLKFEFGGVSDVRIAGISINEGMTFKSLSVLDAGRLAAAVVEKQVPLDLIVHVSATNPRENSVAARLVDLGWTFFVEDRQMLSGGLGSPVSIAPGATQDVPLTLRLDLLELQSGGARDLFDGALAIAGKGPVKKALRLELSPTIQTALGPMRFPAPVVIRRAAANP